FVSLLCLLVRTPRHGDAVRLKTNPDSTANVARASTDAASPAACAAAPHQRARRPLARRPLARRPRARDRRHDGRVLVTQPLQLAGDLLEARERVVELRLDFREPRGRRRETARPPSTDVVLRPPHRAA